MANANWNCVHLVAFEYEMTDVYTAFNGRVTFNDWNTAEPDLKQQIKSFVPSGPALTLPY